MATRLDRLDADIAELDEHLARMRPRLFGDLARQGDTWRDHAAALRFHLSTRLETPLITAIFGGTGTGKSTVLNRLLNREVSATSFHRTFTSGPVGAVGKPENLPANWLSAPFTTASEDELPARGQSGALVLVVVDDALTHHVSLIDTPDLDGEQLGHHAEADRVFRWTQAAVFLVTPEKYQMTELPGYYRLAQRYAVPALFVMNKCEDAAVVEDYRRQLTEQGRPDARIFAIPRDDATYEPPGDDGLTGFRAALQSIRPAEPDARSEGLRLRSGDLLTRLRDTVVSPLREDRRAVDSLIKSLDLLEAGPTRVDVSPLTQELQRRMREQSILYLMGPGRMFDRLRQVPGLLARLPRTAWDVIRRGEAPSLSLPSGSTMNPDASAVPDFAALLADQLVVIQTRTDDLIRANPRTAGWLGERSEAYEATRIDPAEARRIADEELADLKKWLDERWEGAPRDTRAIRKLLKHLPGGERMTRLSEASPYLLAVVLAAHGAVFGHIDLLILGGYGAATWLTEKLSNEVRARAELTNRQMRRRFEELTRDQIGRVRAWLDQQAPPIAELNRLDKLADQAAGRIGQ